jgi:hypothetical protein
MFGEMIRMSAQTAYQWLEPKPSKRFTKQLGIKGRNMLVWHLVADIIVRDRSPEYVAENFFRSLYHDGQQRGQAHHGILLIYEENIRGKDMEPADIVRAIGKLMASGVRSSTSSTS